MAFFSSRKRSNPPPPVAFVDEVPPAPPTQAPYQPTQFSQAPRGAALRLISAPEPVLRLAPAPTLEPEGQETRTDDLRGLPLGTILFRQGLVQQDELEEALVAGMESGERLGEILIRNGLVGQDDVARGLAAQKGLPFVPEEELVLDDEIAALLPPAEARELGAVAVCFEGDAVLVVTADPSAGPRDTLETRLRRPVTEAVVTKGVFDRLLARVEQLSVPAGDEFTASAESTDEAPDHHYESQEDQMEQIWTDPNADETAPNSWSVQTPPQESWSEPAAEVEPEVEVKSHTELETVPTQSSASAWTHEDSAWTQESSAWTQEEPSLTHEESAPAEPADVSKLDAQHEASVGRIEELLTRIDEGASTFADLRARMGGLSESLRTAEETVAERDHRLAELTEAYESDERRIEELVVQLQDREKELVGVGGRLDELNGRLVSAEERLDDRERRLEELFRQVERRDNALTAFEAKLDGIAARFASEPLA